MTWRFSYDGFNFLCKLEGIVRDLTICHTLEQNVVAERMNRALMGKLCCMLYNAALPKSFSAKHASLAC